MDNGDHAGIAEQNLRHRRRGGIAFIGCLQIGDEQRADRRKPRGECRHDVACYPVGRVAFRRRGTGDERVGTANLLFQRRQRVFQHAADEAVDALAGQFRLAVMGGKKNGGQALDDLADRRA